MLPDKMVSRRRPIRLACLALAILTFLVTASSGWATGPGPKQLLWAGESSAIGTASVDAIPGSIGTDNRSQPEATCPSGGQCFADVPSANPFYDFVNRIYQQDLVTGYPCGGLGEPCDGESRPYYRPGANVTRQQMAKFIDNARRLPEIHIAVASGSAPIYSRNDTGTAIAAYSTSGQAFVALSESQLAIYAQTGASTAVYGTATGTGSIGVQGSGSTGVKGISTGGYGVWGVSTNYVGVLGHSNISTGVWGSSDSDLGVYGQSNSGTGVYGSSASGAGVKGVTDGTTTSNYGVAGYATAPAQAGHFSGNVQVTGNLSKGGGSFKIDHPLDPANKYLYHSFVESPDMMNVYNGNVTTDGKGEATIQLPDYFEALNRDFRYQLTVLEQFAQAIVSSKIKDNSFTIKTDKPNVEVSWQVTGIRRDPYANAHRIPVEEEKQGDEKGKYLHPTEWGQPASLGMDYEMQQSLIPHQPEVGQDHR